MFLDANENAFGAAISRHALAEICPCHKGDVLGLTRYPDPLQLELKQHLCNFRNNNTGTRTPLTPEHVYLGVGANEVIDVLIRCFAIPGKDRILTCPPAYAIYSLSAQVNDVNVIEVPLGSAPDFKLDTAAVNTALSVEPHVKMVCLISPNNPTGTTIAPEAVAEILRHPTWNGVVVLDEAYIDYSSKTTSLAQWVVEYPNLVVIQTLSKAFGLAGVRFGVAFASPPISRLLSNLSVNYNLPGPTSIIASYALTSGLEIMRDNRAKMEGQRDRIQRELSKITGIGRLRGGTETNFLLYEVLNCNSQACNETARALCTVMAATQDVVIRFRGMDHGCLGCVRITVGTEEETTRLLAAVKAVLATVRSAEVTCNGLSSNMLR